ncbi:MAG: STAS domain-containing protein [Solirubrobacterales bacterium]
MSRFELTETEAGDGCREIHVEGELDLAVCDRLQEAIGSKDDRILIDLEECRFIDSSAIAVILRAYSCDGSRIVVHSPGGQVLRVLEITGLTGNGLVFGNREQALRALAGAADS